MLTRNTQIPTINRGQVRALVKAHHAWPDFLIGSGKLSASITNAELIAFALGHKDLATKIEAILNLSPQHAQAQAFRTKVKVKAWTASPAHEREQARLRHLTKVLQALEA